MSNGFDISKINFGNLPDSFKVEVNTENITVKTSEALKKSNIDITDGIDKTEAENMLTELDANEDLNIDDDEIALYAKNKGIEGKEEEIKLVAQSITDEAAKAGETEDTAGKEEAAADIKVTIQKWGSAAADGNKYANDCLSHIMANNYPDIEPYSEEWNQKELEIMNANPEIYGTVDEEGNVTGARQSVGGTGRHNAVLYENDELILPGTKPTDPADPATPANTTQKTGDAERVDNPDGTHKDVYKDEKGNITKEENYDEHDALTGTNEYEYNDSGVKTKETNTEFENGAEKKTTVTLFGDDGTTVKSQTVTENIEDGKRITEIDINNHSKVITEFNKDNVKTKETKLTSNENNVVKEKTVTKFEEDGTANITGEKYNDSGVLTEKSEGKLDTNGNKTEDTVYTYDEAGNTIAVEKNKYNANGNAIEETSVDPNDLTKELSKTVNEFDNNNKKTKATHYGVNGTLDSITDYTYNDSGNVQTEIINKYNEENPNVAYETIEKTYSDNGDYTEKTIKADENGEYTVVEYDKDGNVKSTKRFDADGNEITNAE